MGFKLRTRLCKQDRSGCGSRGGFTLLEISLAMTVLLVALLTMTSSTLRMNALRRQNRERAVAQNTIRAISERVHALAGQLRRESNNWSADFVAGVSAGGVVGNEFAVDELTEQAGFPSVGSIELFLNEGQSDEDIGLELGMPRDLDGDGVANNANVTATARIIPVVVRARWTGVSGDVELAHPFYVIGY